MERCDRLTVSLTTEDKVIAAILNTEGGTRKYKTDERFKQEYNYKTFRTRKGKDLMLSIKKKLNRSTEKFYYEKTISNNTGFIIKRDCYELQCGDTELWQISSEELNKGIRYIDERICFINNTITKPKKELQKDYEKLLSENRLLKQNNKDLVDINEKIRKQSEEEFLNSKTYFQMKDELELYKTISKNQGDNEELQELINKKNSEIAALKENIKTLEEKQAEIAVPKRKKGRPALSSEKAEKIRELHEQGYSYRNIADKENVSIGVIHKVLKNKPQN